ncbi:MAG TPA: PfkB family carbohydrate kinase, partial [Longimicrobiales bacterium]|nr:PfkB family carbohydrate kinase [Longimicrobiales bacterium]
HGAILFAENLIFFTPGYPLEDVYDPTGAGDAFAGGFMGYIARASSVSADDLRRAMVYGSALGSFAVERMGVERLLHLGPAEVHQRVSSFRDLTAFDHVPMLAADA